MKNTYVAKDFTEKLATIKEYPLFSSYNQAHLDGKTFKEWLYGQPIELLEEYGNADLSLKDGSGENVILQDMMATVMLLKAAVTNNKGLTEKEIVKEIGAFQYIIGAFLINKQVQDTWKEDIEVVLFKNCTWKGYDKIVMKKNPIVKIVTE